MMQRADKSIIMLRTPAADLIKDSARLPDACLMLHASHAINGPAKMCRNGPAATATGPP